MRRIFNNAQAFALILAGFLALSPLHAARAAQSHIEDPGALLPRAVHGELDAKLTAFERESKIRIVLRFHAKSPGEEEDSVPGAFMRTLSTRLGLIEDGVLAVHFADEDDWRVWIGDNLAARFAGTPGTAKEHTESGAMHDAKEAWFEGVYARADSAKEQAAGTAHADEPRASFVARMIVDGLVSRLAPPRE